MRRLLLVTSFYKPEVAGIACYSTGLAEYFASRGVDVSVLTGRPHYPHWKVFNEYRFRPFIAEGIDGVHIRRRAGYIPKEHNTLTRGLYELTHALSGVTGLGLHRPDVIIGVIPNLYSGVLAALAGRIFHSPFILLVQDLVSSAAVQSGIAGGSTITKPVAKLERWICSRSTAALVVAPGFRPYISTLVGADTPVAEVRNWNILPAPVLPEAAVRERLQLSEAAPLFVHFGNMGYKQDLGNLIDAAAFAAQEGLPWVFLLVGGGNQESWLRLRVRELGLHNVVFRGPLDGQLASSLIACADILILNQRSSVTDMALPSKLTAYFAAGRPVVAAVSEFSEAAQEIRRSGAGVVTSPGDPAKLFHVLQKVHGDPVRCDRLGRAGLAYASMHLQPAPALERLEDLVHRYAGMG